MATPRSAWGIDIGNRALKAIKLVRDGDGVRVDEFEIIEHETVLSNAGDNRESLVQAALARFKQAHPGRSRAAVSVSGQSSFARFIKLPPVEKKKIPEIVRFEAIQQIPFPLDEVEWTYQLFEQPDSPEVEVGIFAMRRDLVNQHIANFTAVDVDVDAVQTSPLAVYNAIQHDGRISGTTMIMDLGAENTDLIIAEGESIWLRSVPIGGNNFTDVLAKQFKLNFQKAEELKRDAATSKYARQIFQAMRPVFADLVAEVQRSIGFYASVHRDSRIKKIIALGGAFRLPGLQKYLHQNLQLDVERFDRLTAGAPADGKAAAHFNENLLSVVSAYGLALQALGMAKINSSLLPQSIRREKNWRDKTPWFIATAALFFIAVGIAMGQLYFQNLSFEKKADVRQTTDRELTTANKLSKAWEDLQGAGGTERQTIDNYRSMADYRDVWPNVLKAVLKPLEKLGNGAAAAPKRSDRQTITYDLIRTEYISDMAGRIGGTIPGPPPSSPGGGFGGMGAANSPPPAFQAGNLTIAGNSTIDPGSRGIVLTLTCITPNKGAQNFIADNLIKTLALLTKDSPAAKASGIWFIGSEILSADQIRKSGPAQAELRNQYASRVQLEQKLKGNGGNSMMPMNDFGAAAGPISPTDPAFIEIATKESMLDDWVIEVQVAYVIPKTGG